ncbi:MAG: ABC transporter permease [Candidatus Caldarchaeum sp.]|nr:ABC transporter permease [Candidatus Caldarchaeum sp.]MCS7134128.1 ABC transporter permease [Candidatus Caldarchaeum sp.]MCX8201127.1 ABC transporter permease [Candidatus Caldarchaeum sp.]MDW8063561.1 ABC transporter permease [Candidatus Caldarchaeum sp.]MDW8434885.1 ABC transporter permease [Candidatus Caldarchaeum sp.]
MGLGRTLAFKAITLGLVLVAVLLLTSAILGVTGVSDKILMSIVNEEVRGFRQSVSRTITDPDALNRAVKEYEEQLIRSYGLDRPWYLRLGDMVVRIIFLDLGNAKNIQSFAGSKKVADIIAERIPNTVLLVTTAIAINSVLGVLIGPRLAMKIGTKFDQAVSYFSAISYALPTWWTGILFILVFAFYVRIFPFGGMYSSPPPPDEFGRFLDLLWHAALPIIVLVMANVGVSIYVTRTLVLNVSQEDFVLAAKARGLPEKIVRRRYVMRVAAPPLLTNIILALAGSLGGAILTEAVFSWPGLGTLFYQAITTSDEALILGLTYIFTLVYVAARFALEALYVVLDPRVRI